MRGPSTFQDRFVMDDRQWFILFVYIYFGALVVSVYLKRKDEEDKD